jgi:hypothetical protein
MNPLFTLNRNDWAASGLAANTSARGRYFMVGSVEVEVRER